MPDVEVEKFPAGEGLVCVYDGPWCAREMEFDPDKVDWLWRQMCKHKSLFSDLTKGRLDNFLSLLMMPQSVWLEVADSENNIVGIIYVTDLHQILDAQVHLMFFDMKLTSKVEFCRKVASWLFDTFHFHRLTATIPSIYYATIRLAERIGFQHEGRKRESQLMGGRWVDEVILGLLSSEAN